MSWDIVLAWLSAAALPALLGALFGAGWYGLFCAKAKAVKELREYSKKLTPVQRELVEKFIERAEKEFATYTGAGRQAKVLEWMRARGIPINVVYVQAVYEYCKRQWGER